MTAAFVGGLFFPRSAELGLAVEDNVSPRVLAKMVYSGTSAASFGEASNDLARDPSGCTRDFAKYEGQKDICT